MGPGPGSVYCMFTCESLSSSYILLRLVEWIPEVPADVSWLFGMAGDVYRQAWKGTPAVSDR